MKMESLQVRGESFKGMKKGKAGFKCTPFQPCTNDK